MKWVLAVLLLANAVAFYWFNVPSGNSTATTEAPLPAGVASLKLLSESSGQVTMAPPEPDVLPEVVTVTPVEPAVQLPDANENTVPPSTAEASTEASTGVEAALEKTPAPPLAKQCLRLGPIEDLEVTRQLAGQLNGMASMTTEDRKRKAPRGFWVYLPPLASDEAIVAKQRELDAVGIDNFVFRQGDLASGISLGFFTAEENARAKQQAVIDQGFNADIQRADDTATSYWLWLPADARQSLSEEFWLEMGSRYTSVKLAEAECPLEGGAITRH